MTEGEIYAVLYEVEDLVKRLPNVYETDATSAIKKIDSVDPIDAEPAIQQRLRDAKSAINEVLSDGRTWI